MDLSGLGKLASVTDNSALVEKAIMPVLQWHTLKSLVGELYKITESARKKPEVMYAGEVKNLNAVPGVPDIIHTALAKKAVFLADRGESKELLTREAERLSELVEEASKSIAQKILEYICSSLLEEMKEPQEKTDGEAEKRV